MRKRNKPILLATLLVVFVGAAVAINSSMMPKKPEQAHDDHAAETPDALGTPRVPGAAESKNTVRSAASALANADAGKPMVKDPRAPGGSSIMKPQFKPTKQMPNDSMTASHWYAKEYGYKGKAPK